MGLCSFLMMNGRAQKGTTNNGVSCISQWLSALQIWVLVFCSKQIMIKDERRYYIKQLSNEWAVVKDYYLNNQQLLVAQ